MNEKENTIPKDKVIIDKDKENISEDLKSENYYNYYQKLENKDNYPKPLYIPKSNPPNNDKNDEVENQVPKIFKENLIKFLEDLTEQLNKLELKINKENEKGINLEGNSYISKEEHEKDYENGKDNIILNKKQNLNSNNLNMKANLNQNNLNVKTNLNSII